ncbi:hypothetical protein QSJ18_04505 [Gordonia sp. ABSL1-1]|uniref:hypothetical protein n=1 Tax=Gordonia sp. ABSL1-1 TaxID=3053923 RepID=UPI00257479D2|nr:hypothetical protein [Gordonia sp. ABSL1-1]MDL9935996.1 hypothetical protein [Gordonia sp. ABSL1-1]
MIGDVLSSYAARFGRMHAALSAVIPDNPTLAPPVTQQQYAISPMAMWAQLALLGSVSEQAAPELFGDAARTREALWNVLDQPHPGCTISSMLWLGHGIDLPGIDAVADKLAERGHWTGRGIPDRFDIEHWTRQRTGGIIAEDPSGEHDPIHFQPFSAAPPALTAAVAAVTAGTWPMPLEICPAGELGDDWPISRVLRSSGPDCGLVRDRVLGLVGLTLNRCPNGLFVASVIADPHRSPDEVNAAALRVLRRFSSGERVFLTNAQLSAGEGDWWRVGSSPLYAGGFVEQQHNSSLMPAWSTTGSYDLMTYGLDHWRTLHEGVVKRVGPPYDTALAEHTTHLEFTATGFTAAGVSGSSIVAGGLLTALLADTIPSEEPDALFTPATGGTIVELEYCHPFAVIVGTSSEASGHLWQGVPLYSAWVAEVTEAVR